MDKETRFLPWLFPRSPFIRKTLLYVVLPLALAAAVAVVSVRFVVANRMLGSEDWFDGSDDRPPIIVKSGSFIIDGGDPSDSSTIKSHWRDWNQDLLSDNWKPDLSTGKHVNRFDVTVTSPTGCAAMSGPQVSIDYVTGTGAQQVTHTFRLRIKPWNGIFRREPKFDPDGMTFQATPGNAATNTPPRLTYPEAGSIAKLTVGSGNCSFTTGQNVVIRIDPAH